MSESIIVYNALCVVKWAEEQNLQDDILSLSLWWIYAKYISIIKD